MKKGFTLIELLAVIAIVAVIITFVVPNVIKLFNQGKNSLNTIQTKQLREAVQLYINDTCLNPIGDDTVCEYNVSLEFGSPVIVSATFTLSDFSEKGYIDANLATRYEGNIVIINNEIDLSDIKSKE